LPVVISQNVDEKETKSAGTAVNIQSTLFKRKENKPAIHMKQKLAILIENYSWDVNSSIEH
jgi:hypothetical protein